MPASPFYDRPRVEPTPEGRRVDRWHATFLGLAALALLVVWIWELARLWPDHGFIGFVFLGILTTLAYALIGAIAFGVFALGRFAVVGLAVFFGLAVWIFGFNTALLVSVPALLATVAGLVQPRSATDFHPVEKRLLEQRIIGDAGTGLGAAVGKFGLDNVTKGIAGEQLTSDTFAVSLDAHPVIQLINGLRFPGTADADVDHALVYGSKVALIDSKYWAGTGFRWEGDALITSGRGATLQAHEIHFPVAVTRLADELIGKEVKAWVVIHGNTGQAVTVEPTPDGLPVLIAGDNWLEEVAAWLTSGQEIPSDDESLGIHCDTVKAALEFKQ